MSIQENTSSKIVTAAMLVIGDEILSGRTQDKNVAYIATHLSETGIQLREVRVIPDIESEIVDAVNHCREKYDYVFTSGGIGPTHDDITADSIGAAFGVSVDYHPEAMDLLTRHYKVSGIEFNDARKRMARIPDGATLVENPVSKAPGFRMENVFVMAGVPLIMQAMLQSILPELDGGAKMLSRTIGAGLPEGKVAKKLGELQEKHPDVSMGSYPCFRQGAVGTNLVLRSIFPEKLENAFNELKEILIELGSEAVETT
ncbi:MAG: competence/damage-inducible protein A [Sneathiella sp.]|nr:competence/damage-inducible protein A [Sneathiella sp.]